MTAMRERASHRGRPRRRGGKAAASQTPGDHAPREDALPLEELDGVRELGHQTPGRHRQHARVVPAVHGELVAPVGHLGDQLGVLGDVLAEQEERRLPAVAVEQVEEERGGHRVRPVVVGQRDVRGGGDPRQPGREAPPGGADRGERGGRHGRGRGGPRRGEGDDAGPAGTRRGPRGAGGHVTMLARCS